MSDTLFEQGVTATTQARVMVSRRMTPETSSEVRQLILRIEEPANYFLEGQNVGVLVPGPHPFGNKSHHRYYSIAGARGDATGVEIELLVRRCSYIDEVSGEEYPGIASHYLCDAQVGQDVTLTGPYHSPFRMPADRHSNLLMLGTGTGIAPFRAFLRRIYEGQQGWDGQVRLYYGARSGVDMLYMNRLNSDIADYFTQDTFQAIQALSKGVLTDEGDALKGGLEAHAEDVWAMLQQPQTHVYLAGMSKVAEAFDVVMSRQAGSELAWQDMKQAMIEARRWSQLTYI